MANQIDGVQFYRGAGYALCHVDSFSVELESIIRKNLTSICHGSYVSEYPDASILGYSATLRSFLERYDAKTDLTKIGMIGEFLSHVLITALFDEFDVASAYFNLEEKSIKKGFDLLLYNTKQSTLWITEVKSGKLHKGKNYDQTAMDLLNLAKTDLDDRLNKFEQMYWLNAISSIRASLSDEKDYKAALVNILLIKGSAVVNNKPTSNDCRVLLVSNLFEPLGTKITNAPANSFITNVKKTKPFAEVLIFCVQKETHTKIETFLRNEALEA